jgi:hypothetical protein
VVPGWHSTIFPPYFVAGAVFSGFAMVLTLLIPLRASLPLEDFITMRHLDNMAKVMLAMGLIVAYGYLMENFNAWYSGDVFEIHTYANRFGGSMRGLLGPDVLQRNHPAAAVVPAGAPQRDHPVWLSRS